MSNVPAVEPAPADAEPMCLTEAEVRRVVRLLADALAPDDGRAAKVGRLMDGLCAMADADGWFWLRSRVRPDGLPENFDFLYGGGLDEGHLALYTRRSMEVDGEPPENAAAKRRLADGRHVTYTRGQAISDALWHGPANAAYIERMGFDDMLFSVNPIGAGDGGLMISYVILFRRAGRPGFEPRHARLVHAIVSECGPLHVAGLNLTVSDDVATLTPRQRTVLILLIDGLSVKQIALHLGLSHHTVVDYCKALHRHFGVNSRAELLRRFMTGGA